MMERMFFIVLALPIGACLGSFASTAALRHLRHEQAISGRSRCDGCAVQLSFVQTFPVIAFARQGGRCQSCDGRIDRIHLVGELSGAVVLASATAFSPLSHVLPLTVLGLALLASSVVDAKTRRLPDVLTVIVAAMGVVLSALRSWDALMTGVIVALVAFALLEGVRRGFRSLTGRAGLGFGDVKLIAALALWLGLVTPWAVCLSALIGLGGAVLRRDADERLAFGPYIAVAAWIVGLGMEAGRWPLLA